MEFGPTKFKESPPSLILTPMKSSLLNFTLTAYPPHPNCPREPSLTQSRGATHHRRHTHSASRHLSIHVLHRWADFTQTACFTQC